MTAHAVGSPSTVSASSKGAPNTPAQTPAAGFAHQLHAARQHGGPTAQEHRAAQQASPERRSVDDRGKDPAPSGTDTRRSDVGADRADKSPDRAPAKGDAASSVTSSPQTTAKAAAAPASGIATPLLAEAVADVSADDVAPDKKDTDDSEQGAAALVGAMLALVGPAAGKVLTLGAAGQPATSGKPVAANVGAAVLPQGGDAAPMTVTDVASAIVPAQLLVVGDLRLGPKDVRDFARTDAAPTLALSAPTLAAPATLVSPPILVPASAHTFAQELGQQVTWFVGQGIKQARIRLHPDELGALDLKISVNHGRVDVVFHAQHPGAVAAVQQSLPQLDQMLAQHGLSLGNTEVGQHDRGDPSGHAGRGDKVSEMGEIHDSGVVTPLSQLGLLDAFA